MTGPERPRTSRERRRLQQAAARRKSPLSRRLGPLPVWAIAVAVLGTVAIIAIAVANTLSGAETGRKIRYDVGQPGVGEEAPEFELASANGVRFKLSEQRGKQVLLYFHEGLGCAPCWKQIDDIQADLAKFTALGIDQVASISLDPLAAQQQRAKLRGISFPVLVDSERAVSATYDALSYGMMGGSTPGHTFILVGGDGKIRWRADYGGPPNFTMFVPNATLLTELKRVLGSP